jgi:hypothetical protein
MCYRGITICLSSHNGVGCNGQEGKGAGLTSMSSHWPTLDVHAFAPNPSYVEPLNASSRPDASLVGRALAILDNDFLQHHNVEYPSSTLHIQYYTPNFCH